MKPAVVRAQQTLSLRSFPEDAAHRLSIRSMLLIQTNFSFRAKRNISLNRHRTNIFPYGRNDGAQGCLLESTVSPHQASGVEVTPMMRDWPIDLRVVWG